MITKIKAWFEALRKKLKPYQKNIIHPLLKILAIIIVCAVVAHLMGGHETLQDYANKNPDIAYSQDK